MALQAYQLAADSPKKSDGQKTCCVSSEKDFGEYLKDTLEIMKKHLINNKSQKNDILLMQLLNLLNMNISVIDFETIIGHQLPCADISLPNIDFKMEFSADELTRCWQEILSEFNKSGNVNQTTVKMFYLAIKKAVPEMSNIDLKTLHNQINEMLEINNYKSELTEDFHMHQNSLTQEHSFITLKTTIQDGNENDEFEKPKLQYSKQSQKDGSYADVVGNENKKAHAENHAFSNELRGRQTVHVDDDISQYQDISPFSMKESFIAPSDKVGTNTTISSAGSYHTSEIFEQLVDKMNLAIKGDVKQVNIRLKPDHLGDVLIKVFTDKDKVKAELFVDNTQVRTMLKVHALDFQNQIREQGYNLSEISVFKMSDGLEMGAFNQQSSSKNHYQSRRPTGFYKQETENHESFIDDYYDRWGNVSSINFIA